MMSKALKWIPDKHDYIPYDLPNGACFIPIIWNKRLPAASAVKRLSLEIATPAGQSIQSLVLVMQNAKIATVKI